MDAEQEEYLRHKQRRENLLNDLLDLVEERSNTGKLDKRVVDGFKLFKEDDGVKGLRQAKEIGDLSLKSKRWWIAIFSGVSGVTALIGFGKDFLILVRDFLDGLALGGHGPTH